MADLLLQNSLAPSQLPSFRSLVIAGAITIGVVFPAFLFPAFLFPALSWAENEPSASERIRTQGIKLAPSTTVSPDLTSSADPRVGQIAQRLRQSVQTARQASAIHRRHSATASRQPRGFAHPAAEKRTLRMHKRAGTPRELRGKRLQPAIEEGATEDERDRKTARAFLQSYRRLLKLKNPDRELQFVRRDSDARRRRHLRYVQRHEGLPVWPNEVLVHLTPAGDVDGMTGAYVPTPRKINTRPTISAANASAQARLSIPNGADAVLSSPTLLIYSPLERRPRLAWRFDVPLSADARWFVVIDAHTGSTLDAYNQVQDSHVAGHVLGSGIDLGGTTRPLNVWSEGGTFYMVDTSKPMFDLTSDPPARTTTRGGIVVLDARNLGPQGNVPLFQVTSPSAGSWSLPDAVSASFNLSETYDYFLQRHGRNSLDGQGGTITGIVRLGQNYDNAFWNGELIAFGTGHPFAGVLDVVGHELTHGVTQHTAELVYLGQTGALNEAFSDIFGEMVQARTTGAPDWIKGGPALGLTVQNYANPNSIQCLTGIPCPARMSQYVTTTLDNGGVHTNSSIINHAFYRLAQGMSGAIGLEDAEQIFYCTLTTRLVKQSQFIDARLGAIACAEELFGEQSSQAQRTGEAFDAVEIVDAPPSTQPTPGSAVSGPDSTLFLFFDLDFGNMFLGRRETALGDGSSGTFLSSVPAFFTRPSVTGDGSLAVFVNEANDICLVATDGSFEQCLGHEGSTHSAAVSPDGNLFAFVLVDALGIPLHEIELIDLDTDQQSTIPLQSPLLDGGTVNVEFADTLNFTRYGKRLFYDAFNHVNFADGSEIGLWSIYAVDLTTNTVATIVPPTPGLDLGNPALGHTSDTFLVYEAVDTTGPQTTIVASNGFAGTHADVATVSLDFTIPGYTGDDTAIVYSTPDPLVPTGISLKRQALAADKITPSGAPALWLTDADSGVIYRRGPFTAPTSATLTISKIGAGSGLVTSNPTTVVCGTTCSGNFEKGTVATLTATASPGSAFAGWTGCTPLPGDPVHCQVTMNASKTVRANFRALPVKRPPPARTPPPIRQ